MAGSTPEKAEFSVAASALSASARRPLAQACQIRRAQPSTPARAGAEGSAPVTAVTAAAGSRSSETSHSQCSLRSAWRQLLGESGGSTMSQRQC